MFLLGKNLLLARVIVAGIDCFVDFARVEGWLAHHSRASSPRISAAVFAVTSQLTIANWSSLSFPKKMEIGKFKGQRNNGVAVWTAFGVQILVGGIATVVLLAGRWFGSPWLPAAAFAGLTVATLGGYIASLDSLDRLAEQEKRIAHRHTLQVKRPAYRFFLASVFIACSRRSPSVMLFSPTPKQAPADRIFPNVISKRTKTWSLRS